MDQPKLEAKLNKAGSWIDAVIAIGAGIALPIWTWAHRPMELRTLSDSAIAALRDEWMFKPPFFYGSFFVAVALLIYGFGKLASLNKT